MERLGRECSAAGLHQAGTQAHVSLDTVLGSSDKLVVCVNDVAAVMVM